MRQQPRASSARKAARELRKGAKVKEGHDREETTGCGRRGKERARN